MYVYVCYIIRIHTYMYVCIELSFKGFSDVVFFSYKLTYIHTYIVIIYKYRVSKSTICFKISRSMFIFSLLYYFQWCLVALSIHKFVVNRSFSSIKPKTKAKKMIILNNQFALATTLHSPWRRNIFVFGLFGYRVLGLLFLRRFITILHTISQ